jgi:hypothetical protein
MWSERFVIVVTSLQRGALPSSWSSYSPTLIDGCLLFGSMSLFLLLFLVFVRFVPFIALSELKLLRRKEPGERPVSP